MVDTITIPQVYKLMITYDNLLWTDFVLQCYVDKHMHMNVEIVDMSKYDFVTVFIE